jgi:subtilisin family serine protease
MHQLIPVKSIALSNAWLFRCNLGIACAPLSRVLYQLPEVRYAYPDFIRPRYTRFYPDDPMFTDQWHLYDTEQNAGLIDQDVDILSAWNDYTGSGITIAVVDDGLETTHVDLAENIVPGMSWDYVENHGNPNGGSGHGTSVAGVAAARGGNGIGVTGAAPAGGGIGG